MRSKLPIYLIALVGALMPAAAVLHAGGLSTQLGEVVIENLQVGHTYVLSQLANLKMIVTNTSAYPVNLNMDILKPDASELRLGALMIPETSWVRLSQDHFKIAPNEQASSEITISIPNNNDYGGKSVRLQTNLDILYLNLRDTFLISKSFRF